MGDKVFVPVTDRDLERPGVSDAPLVPYHPDRPCWRLDPALPLERGPARPWNPQGRRRAGSARPAGSAATRRPARGG